MNKTNPLLVLAFTTGLVYAAFAIVGQVVKETQPGVFYLYLTLLGIPLSLVIAFTWYDTIKRQHKAKKYVKNNRRAIDTRLASLQFESGTIRQLFQKYGMDTTSPEKVIASACRLSSGVIYAVADPGTHQDLVIKMYADGALDHDKLRDNGYLTNRGRFLTEAELRALPKVIARAV